MLQIVASLTDDSRGVIYNGNMFIVQASEHGLPLGPELTLYSKLDSFSSIQKMLSMIKHTRTTDS